jgi:WD40 repeat protein
MSEMQAISKAIWWVMILGAVMATPAIAGGQGEFKIAGPGDLLSGEFDATALDADGALLPAPAVEEVMIGEAVYVWDLVPDGEGGVYAATGSEGKLFHIQKDGEYKSVADTFEYELFALARSSQGDCFVSGAPNGTITRISAAGDVENLLDLPEGLIWDLLLAPDGRLFASAGQEGEIYQVDESGEAVSIGSIPDAHAVKLVWWNDRIVCGSDGTGLVSAIDPDNGNVEILYDAHQEEVVDMLPLGPDRLFFAVNGNQQQPAMNGNGAMVLPVIEVRPDGSTNGPTVYELTAEGLVRPVWSSSEEDIFCLCQAPDGTVLVGTGGKGLLYQLDSYGNATRLLDLDDNQVLSLARAGEQVFLGTGNGGSVYRLNWTRKRDGLYTSKVFDARQIVRWGSPYWVSSGKGTVSMETRSGYIESPGESWSEWQSLQSGKVASPAGRFFQWRMALAAKAEDRTFKVNSIRFPYRGANRAPEIKMVSVSAKSSAKTANGNGNGGRYSQSLPGGVKVEYSIDDAKLTSSSPHGRSTGWVRNFRAATWKADDLDGDCLTFDLYLRFAHEETYFLLTKDLESAAYSWDASAWPEGWYELKVVAKDEACNPPGDGLEAMRLSAPFQVDNTAPELTGLSLAWEQDGETAALMLKGSCSDHQSLITGLEISLNGEGWRFIQPEDGLFDARTESFRVAVPEMDDGSYPAFVGVRGVDEVGHFSTGRIAVPDQK